MASPDPGPSIDERLAAAGLSPLPRTAWLEIDLGALVDNLTLLREAAGPGVPVRPVVKADAYGHGAIPVARALVEAGVDGLCVATFDEALALRAARLRCPILVLYPIPPAWAPEAARRAIAVAAGDPVLLTDLLAALRSGRRPGSRRLRIELEVETGLGRGGFLPDDVVVAAMAIRAGGAILGGLWTHLQAPEDPERTAAQLRRFEAATSAVRAAGIRLPARHATASAGLLIATDGLASYDGVRPGLAIYGSRPMSCLATRPRPGGHRASSRSCPSVRDPSGSPTCRAGGGSAMARPSSPSGPAGSRRCRWATATAGPGRSRIRASALVRGVQVPLVGNVAMDAVMADVTDVPGPPVGVADEFTLIGRQGGRSITWSPSWRRRAPRTRGRSSRPWPGGYPGCTMPDPDLWVFAR